MKIKRIFCGMLAAFLISYMPLTAYASLTTSVAVSAGEYIINLILNACGVDFSASSITSILGQWTDYDDYMEKGEKGELGAFSQYLYNQSVAAETEELKEDARRQIEALNNAVNSAWGTVITGVKGLISAVKKWLLEIDGYGTVETTYYVSQARSAGFIFGVDSYVSADYFPLRSQPSYSYIYQVLNNPENEYSFSSFYPTVYTGYAKVQNFYKPKTVTVAGLFSGTAANPRTDFYYKSGDTVKTYNFFYHYETLDADGNYKFNLQTSSHGTISYITCKNCNALPFPVFTSLEAVEKYLNTGEAVDVYDPDKIVLETDAINTDIQNMPLKSIPDTITLPQEKDVPLHVQNISGALVTGEDALKVALEGAGIAIDWGEEDTKEDETTDADLKAITGAIEALPDRIEEKLETDGETAKKRLTLSSTIIDKFPFCVPFDLIYLIETLKEETEVPIIRIPIEFNYLDFSYNEVFVVDFSDYSNLVAVLRVMLDLLFCSGLIMATRELIRG